MPFNTQNAKERTTLESFFLKKRRKEIKAKKKQFSKDIIFDFSSGQQRGKLMFILEF